MIKPTPTKRAVIDVGRKCNARCKFCYYSHLGDLTEQKFTDYNILTNEIDKAYDRGCNYIDFTGGEPTIYPKIENLVEYALINYNMKSCIITNGLCGENTIDKLLTAGVDDFLLSVEGLGDTHDKLVNVDGATEKQMKFLNHLDKNNISFRINTVINKFNQDEIKLLADLYVHRKARIVNFINFNPHHDWKDDKDGTKKIIANLSTLQPILDKSINLLEKAGIGVNLRYYPMCRIEEKHRKNVCNDLHVSFDPYEWDYEITPKTPEAHLNWAIRGSQNVENKGYPCSGCNLLYICGGVNKAFLEASGEECVHAVKNDIEDKFNFYLYRKENYLTLEERAE